MIQELIDSALILDTVRANEKVAALDEILERTVADGRLPQRLVKSIRKKLLDREAIGSTGIGNGVAVPHVKLAGIERLTIVLARSIDGIDYAAVDGREVYTVFMILAPEDAAEAHLKVLRWVSSLARNADFRRFVKGAASADEIRDLLREMSAER